jgi:hypothetical protein
MDHHEIDDAAECNHVVAAAPNGHAKPNACAGKPARKTRNP